MQLQLAILESIFQPLLAQVDLPSLLAGALPGTIIALVTVMKTRQEGKREIQRDTIGEYQGIADRQQKEIDENKEEARKSRDAIDGLRVELTASRVAEAKCQGQVAQLQSDVRTLSNDLRRLQEMANDLPPGVTRPVVIIATITGKILSVSNEVGSMFNWLPKELLGKSIELLMPRELKPIHRRALEKLAIEGRTPNPDKPVLTYGLTKSGVKFPILVTLSGWSDDNNIKYVNAEIRRRGDSDRFPTPHFTAIPGTTVPDADNADNAGTTNTPDTPPSQDAKAT